MSESIYRDRMSGYYPQVIQELVEFQALIDGEYPEFDLLFDEKLKVLDNAYLRTMDIDRVRQWEQLLKITPDADATLDNRRNIIMARLRGQGKLNTALISAIVNAFTDGSADSWVEDGVLYIEVTPPPGNKEFKFSDIEQELKLKLPAHLALSVTRSYNIWDDIKTETESWKEVTVAYPTWWDVLNSAKRKPNELGVTTLENFYLG